MLLRILRFEYFIVEAFYRYFPLRWCEFGSTLLIIPNAENMSVAEIQAAFKDRYRIAGRLPCVQDNPQIIEFAL